MKNINRGDTFILDEEGEVIGINNDEILILIGKVLKPVRNLT
jgi:hypothetical protein